MTGSLTIVGLGPGDPGLRTLNVQSSLERAEKIIFRTAIHLGVDDILSDPRTTTCDDIYETSSSFDEVYQRIVDRVIDEAKSANVVFAVPGHPLFGERTVSTLICAANDAGLPVKVETSVSALDVMSTALQVDLLATQTQILDATAVQAANDKEPFSGGSVDISPARPVLVTQVYSQAVSSAVKLGLSRFYPDDHPIRVITAAGVPEQELVVDCSLHELDHHKVDHLTSVWVPALEPLEAYRSASTLQRIIAVLRSPQGCPWDRKQTHASLRAAVIEEAYEVVDAIDEDDPEHLAEELGDLLLQVALLSQIAEEDGSFAIEDVCDHVNRKLIRRHPHVFGQEVAETPADVIRTWQGVKAEERRQKGETDTETTPFDKLPRSMPILTRIAQLSEAESDRNAEGSAGELGDLLLNTVEDIVRAGLDPERELGLAYRRRLKVAASSSKENQ